MKAKLVQLGLAVLVLFSVTSCSSIDPGHTHYVLSHTGKGSVRAVR
jgi:hypothetical protein